MPGYSLGSSKRRDTRRWRSRVVSETDRRLARARIGRGQRQANRLDPVVGCYAIRFGAPRDARCEVRHLVA
jgi:hypothetical protein